MSQPPWYILGAGSLGTLWACRLARAGLDVRLLVRHPERLAGYQQGAGLRLVEGDNETRFALPAETADAQAPIGRLLVACKAYDAEAAVGSIGHRLSPGAVVVLLQNGLGSQQAVAALVPAAQVVFGSTTEGAWKRPDGAVVFAGQGSTWLGRPHGAPAPTWLEDLALAGITCQWTPRIMEKLWRKLAINCAINPLTVLNQCRNGELRAYPKPLAALCKELAQLLQAVGQAEAAIGLGEEVDRVIDATAMNYSSMYQDVANGRRTEISYLSGYACTQAQHMGLALPTLDNVHRDLLEYLRDAGLATH